MARSHQVASRGRAGRRPLADRTRGAATVGPADPVVGRVNVVPMGGLIRRMSPTAAMVAKDEERSVWIKDSDGHWVCGRIRAISNGQATVEFDNGTRLTVPVAEIQDVPPPDIGLDPGVNRLRLALRPEPGALSVAAAAEATSPRVTHYVDILASLHQDAQAAAARRLMLGVHPDKTGGDAEDFRAIKIALELLQSGPVRPAATTEPLLLTHGDETLGPALGSFPAPVDQPPPLAIHLPVAGPMLPPPRLRQPALAMPILSPPVRIPKELNGLPFSAADVQVLRTLRQVTEPHHLARLASTGRSASVLARIGSLRTVHTVQDIALVAGLTRRLDDLARLDALAPVQDLADLVALAHGPFDIDRLTGLAVLAQVHDRAELEQVAALAMPTADLVTLGRVPQARQVADLLALASHVGVRGAADLVAIGRLRTVTSVRDVVDLVALTRPLPELASLAALPLVGTAADLLVLAASACPVGRLTALAPLVQVHTPADLVQLATLPTAAADLAQLAGLGQASSLATLVQIAGAVVGTRTAADVVVVAGLGSATFAAPSAIEIVRLCALTKTAAQIAQLATAAGVGTAQQLITRADATDTKEKADDEWSVIDNRWFDVKDGFTRAGAARFPLTALFTRLDNVWHELRPVMTRMPRGKRAPADPNDLQACAMAYAEMATMLDLVGQLIPALEQGATVLADLDQRVPPLLALLTEIDTHLIPFYPAPSPGRANIATQRAKVAAALAVLEPVRTQVQLDRTAFAAANPLTAAVVAAALVQQSAHAAKAAAAPETAGPISALLAPQRTVLYQERLRYPNLRLTPEQLGDPFWQSLLPADKAKFNTKIAGFPVTGWTVQNYPSTRREQRKNGYTGNRILVPTLQGFPCSISGEVVHDWTFDTPKHGHPAAEMSEMINLAQAGKQYRAGPHMAFDSYFRDDDGRSRRIYSWWNTLIQIVISNRDGALITYFNPT